MGIISSNIMHFGDKQLYCILRVLVSCFSSGEL